MLIGRQRAEPCVVLQIQLDLTDRHLRRTGFSPNLFFIFPAIKLSASSTGIVYHALHTFLDVGQIFRYALQGVEAAGLALGDNLALRRNDGINDVYVPHDAAVGKSRDIAGHGDGRNHGDALSDGGLNFHAAAPFDIVQVNEDIAYRRAQNNDIAGHVQFFHQNGLNGANPLILTSGYSHIH